MFISYHGDPLASLGGIQSGGQNTYVKEVVCALESLGFSADVFTHWSDSSSAQQQKLGAKSRVIRFAAGNKGFVPKQQLYMMIPQFIKEITSFIQSPYQYSLIHSNYWLSGHIGMNLQEKFGLPLVHTSHSLGIVRENAVENHQKSSNNIRLETEKTLLQNSDCVIATTQTERDLLHDFYKVSHVKIKNIPCGVNTNIFRPLQYNPSIVNLADDQKMILFVGRFEENKGLGVLLQAIVYLRKQNPLSLENVRLMIGGGDPLDINEKKISTEKKKYQKFIDDNHLSQYVQFLGPLSHEQLSHYFSRAKMTVVPSYYESFGMVAVEAMACGCPVIASNTGGLRHNVLHGKTGLLAEPKDSISFSNAICELLKNDSLNNWMSKNAAIYAKRFSWLQVAADLAKIYREVILCKNAVNIHKNTF